MKKIPYLDLKQHFRDWHRFVLPLFVVIAAILMIIILIVRAGNRSPFADWDPASTARIGLLYSGGEAVFDPAFAVASPIEMALAPKVDNFDYPVGSRHGALTYNAQPFLTDRHLGDDLNGIGGWNSDLGDPVYAIADGLVLSAGWPSDGWGNVIILLHELTNGTQVETFYAHLDSMTVPVGRQVRRGEKIGTIGTAGGTYLAHLHLELRTALTIGAGGGYSDKKLGRVSGELAAKKWRSKPEDQLVSAPAGKPLEAGSFQLDVEGDEESRNN